MRQPATLVIWTRSDRRSAPVGSRECSSRTDTPITVVIPVSGGGSLTDYLASLQQILELKPATVLPAHGPEIEDPAPLIEHYYDHRRRREEQVVAALRAGCTTREVLVERIYPDLSSDLVRAASETIWAHLIKLRDEGRVREEDGEWFLH